MLAVVGVTEPAEVGVLCFPEPPAETGDSFAIVPAELGGVPVDDLGLLIIPAELKTGDLVVGEVIFGDGGNDFSIGGGGEPAIEDRLAVVEVGVPARNSPVCGSVMANLTTGALRGG